MVEFWICFEGFADWIEGVRETEKSYIAPRFFALTRFHLLRWGPPQERKEHFGGGVCGVRISSVWTC